MNSDSPSPPVDATPDSYDSAQFDSIRQTIEEAGVRGGLDTLEKLFTERKQFHELFEVLKMKVRRDLKLPLLFDDDGDDLDAQQSERLEQGLLQACRTVGTLFFENGQPREGWMFLQPVGDRNLAQTLITNVPVDEENADTIIDVALTEGAAPLYGFELLLERFGTCNAITAFDSQVAMAKRSVRVVIAERLVTHLYEEIRTNVVNHIRQQEETEPTGSLRELIAERPWLFSDGSHHVDTTHLASVVRIGRIVESEQAIDHAAQLVDYGMQLDDSFHFPGEPPFESTYRDHQSYYHALQGDDVEASVEHFRRKAKSVDSEQFGTMAVETLVDLLTRLNRFDEAMQVSADALAGQPTLGIAPSLMEIAAKKGEFQAAAGHYRKQQDLLAYAIAILQDAEAAAKK